MTIQQALLELAGNTEYAERLKASFPEIFNRKMHEVVTLSWDKFKGSGKCWVARIDPETKKIQGFLNAESVEASNYKGEKTFSVPLEEGSAYHFREAGSKSCDRNYYKIVRAGVLENL